MSRSISGTERAANGDAQSERTCRNRDTPSEKGTRLLTLLFTSTRLPSILTTILFFDIFDSLARNVAECVRFWCYVVEGADRGRSKRNGRGERKNGPRGPTSVFIYGTARQITTKIERWVTFSCCRIGMWRATKWRQFQIRCALKKSTN